MNIGKKIIRILIITSIILMGSKNSYADSSITIDQIFIEEQGTWYPGRLESKDFYINNNKENDISIDRLYMSLKSSEYWKTGEELDINSSKLKEFAKYSTVTLKHNNNVLFKDKFENLLSKDGINLSKDIYIKSNSKELLNMTIDMNLEMNNDAQALDNVFNIGVSYKMDENTTPPINPDINNPKDPDKPGTDVDGSQSGKLPQTGGIINGASLVVLGSVAIGTGFILNKKSSKEKGGKHHE
ncbi:LPXTG cell wall anchor domain-containing protein [Paraclostridium bifermentans]|uniref:LPXTG cell wall anchor domain-containing protein n=1 Tax=Paraclostridium bifermentans TaxID=1490 RepID=A0AA44DN55_PARBF|nr:LPXTG cell wall anchor domain-containing protein [Paraclostridium bifermentans]MBN8048815.1 LPXTG cell wall anchor domain-containing protein [Paraclostridium bifermentans]NME10648.1 LPXTG cell wall anchor domain-containing protein [Paraclostridium bifermentans]